MKSALDNLLSWSKRNNRGEKIVAVVVLALAACCMFYNLDLNPRPWQDEGSAAGIAKSLVQNGVYAIRAQTDTRLSEVCRASALPSYYPWLLPIDFGAWDLCKADW